MTEADISPLAKRLAEENNVDWRKLSGSGAEGKVVERDVLEYLARVMSGQEDVDPTPEPLPEGMEEWPDEDIAAYRRGARERAEAASSPTGPSSASPTAAATPPEETEIDEDIFLFEDDLSGDVDGDAGFDEPTDVFAVSGADDGEDDEDLFLDFSSEDEVGQDPGEPAGAPAADFGAMAFDLDDEPDQRQGRADVRDLAFVGTEDEVQDVVAEPSREAPQAAPHDEPMGTAARGAPEAVPGDEIRLVTYGRLLRRHLDLTAVKNAQAALGRELGREEIGIGAFLARAAGKALRAHPIGEGGVVLASVEGGLAYVDVRDPAAVSFGDLLAHIDRAQPAVEPLANAALVVVDLSVLDVDEAVLDAGAPVLSLGRVLYDDQAGDVRGTLALSGDVPFETGGKMLAAVAELLAEPVRLLV